MAEPRSATKQALKKLEDQLTCAICLEPYKDPKLLQCFHVFCEQCLVRLVVHNQQGQLAVRCPKCHRSTILPAASVSGLQPAFHIHHLLDVKDTLEKEPQATNTDHVTGDVGKSVPPKVTLYCRFHKDRELELYCETCEELICLHCTVRQHNGHQYDLVSEMFEKHKSEITASLEPVEKQLASVNQALEILDRRGEQITDQRTTVEADIHKTIQGLHEELDIRRMDLIGQLNHMTELKMKNLAVQREELKELQTQLNNCLEVVRESLKTGSEGEVMNMKKSVVTQVNEMTAVLNADVLKTAELADMKFKPFSLLPGRVYLQQVSPEECFVSTKGIQITFVKEKTAATLHVVDRNGEACVVPVESVNCELASEITAEKTKCTAKQQKIGLYEISYQPGTRGRHQLNIKVEGEHIKGSPFSVMVKLPTQKLSAPIKIIDGLRNPCGVAVNHRGEVIVAENGGHCISIFSPSGKKLRKFGSRGSGRGQFSYPCGVEVDDVDNVLLLDGGNHRIQKFTTGGQFLATVGSKGSGPLQFSSPVGFAIHPLNKKVYVADSYNHRIQIMNSDFTFSSVFGSKGSANGQFQYPWDVAFKSTGNVYVADYSNHCIQVFTAEGTFLRKFGRKGQGDGELNSPSSVTIDPYDDLVYVAEKDNNRVSVFSSEGKFLTSFGRKRTKSVSEPCGITVDTNGMVYVSDTHNGRICIY